MAFASTHWSVIRLVAEDRSPESARAALSTLCQAYWPPLYTFVRRRGYSSPDAQDTVQAFFETLLKQDSFRRADPEKGRLRTFLLGSLQHFLADRFGYARALKRGGGKQTVSLDELADDAASAVPVADDLDAARSYDRAWAAALLDRAWENLHDAFVKEGKEKWLQAVKPFVLGGSEPALNQEQLAAKLNVPASTLRTSLQRLRQRYREALRAEVAQTVSDAAEVDAEMRYLYRVLVC